MSIRLRGRGTATFLLITTGSTAPVSLADECRFRYNTLLDRAELSENAGAYGPLVGAGGTMLTVTNIAALAAVDEAPLTNGVSVSMLSLMCQWQLDKTATDAPDGITIIATLSGTGRWFRIPGGSVVWRKQLTWKIDQHPGVGKDENVGSLASPLATWDEFRRRHGAVLGSGVTVTVTLDGPAGVFTGDINVDMFLANGETLVIKGTQTVLYTGSVTAYQAWNPALTHECEITDTAIPVSWTASGLIDHQIVMTNGANVGAATFATLDLTGKKCRTHWFYDPATNAKVEPIVTSTFTVCSCTAVGNVYIGTGLDGLVKLQNLYISSLGTDASIYSVINCKVIASTQFGGAQYWHGGMANGAQRAWNGLIYPSATITKSGYWEVAVGAAMDVVGVGLFQTDSYVQADPGASVKFSTSVAFFDCTASEQIQLQQDSFVNVTALLWGTGNASPYAIRIDADGCFSCATVGGAHAPTIAGRITGDANVGGTSKSFADITAGYINPTNLARAVVSL